MTADRENHHQDSPRAPSSPAGPPAGLLTVLLVAVSLAIGLALICGAGWYLAAQRPARLADLSPQQRWQLLQDAESHNPGLYQATWFAPRIGYTLQPGKEVEAWNTKFTANALGYRSGPPHKPEDTFRLLFVGDSWTFGMGVDADQAFPQRLAQLAQKAQAALADGRRIESWSLALPGYNTPAQLAAVEYFGDRLAADAVVLCPTPNDNHSLPAVTAAGALTYGGGGRDRFAEPHPVVYRRYRVLSHRYLERWRLAFGELADAADRLSQQEIPVFFFFTGTWDNDFVHWQIDQAAIQQPVAITPMAWTTAEYRNPPPIDHPNAEAHDLYAGLLYDFLAPHLGWPRTASSTTDQRPPDATLARQQAINALLADTAQMAASFQPGSADPGACTTAGTCRDGQVGAGTTVLIRRSPDTETLQLEFARVDLPSLYPQTLQVHIASPNGGTVAQFDIPSAGTLPPFLLPLPTDIPVGHALDVTIQPHRVAADSGSLRPQSVRLRSLELR